MSSDHFAIDPTVTLRDIPLAGATWEDVDREARALVGRPCIAVPSVRVGIAWTLEHLGLRRHKDHVLVPRFTSRCILSSLDRYALPVESPTEKTRAVLVVHQYGFRQDLATIQAASAERGWTVIEDAAYGPMRGEAAPLRSIVRFIGLTKTLPVIRGAIALTDDGPLAEMLRRERSRGSAWSYPVLLALLLVRSRGRTSGSSDLAEIAFEAYHSAGGGDRWTRGNLLAGLRQIPAFAAEASRRQQRAKRILGEDLVVSSEAITPYLGLYRPASMEAATTALRVSGFMAEPHHIDLAFNVLQPRYESGLLVPFNPRIDADDLDRLLSRLAEAAVPAA